MQEASARKFTCVQLLFSDGPLESEVQVEFYTQDGSAEGIASFVTFCIYTLFLCLYIDLCADTRPLLQQYYVVE